MRKKTTSQLKIIHNDSIFKDKVIYEIYLEVKDERYKQYVRTDNCDT